MKSHWNSVDFRCNITDLITRGSLGTETRTCTHTHRERNVKMKAETGGCIYKPEYQRSPASHRKLGERQERTVPSEPSEGASPADT